MQVAQIANNNVQQGHSLWILHLEPQYFFFPRLFVLFQISIQTCLRCKKKMALWQSQPIQCKVVLAFMVKGLQAHLTADSQWLFSGGEMWIPEYFFVACVSYLQHFNPCRWHMDGSMVWKFNMAGCGPSFEHSLPPKQARHTLWLLH